MSAGNRMLLQIKEDEQLLAAGAAAEPSPQWMMGPGGAVLPVEGCWPAMNPEHEPLAHGSL